MVYYRLSDSDGGEHIMIDNNVVVFIIWSYYTWTKRIIKDRRAERRARCGR